MLNYQIPGKVIQVNTNHKQAYIEIVAEGAVIHLYAYSGIGFRILYQFKGQKQAHEHKLIIPESPALSTAFQINDTKEQLVFSSEEGSLVLDKSNSGICFKDPKGLLLSEDHAVVGASRVEGRMYLHKKLQPYERFIGLGEKGGPLDRRNRAFTNWNTDQFGYGVDSDPLYASIPFFIGIHSGGKAYGLYLNNPAKSSFNFGASNNEFMSICAETGSLDYFLFTGNPLEIVQKYTRLTGLPSLPPKWSMGLQQCRYSYYPQREVLRIVEQYRDRNIPLDVIYLDIHYMQDFKVFTWSKENFPNPDELLAHLNDLGVKVVVILDPGIKADPSYPPYQELKAINGELKILNNTEYQAQVWPGWCVFPDFGQKKVRNWWAEKVATLRKQGITGFWTDMNEIASWGQSTPELVTSNLEGEVEGHLASRNLYGQLMAQATKEGAKLAKPEERSFVLTRAGFAGIQRHAAVWTGDNSAYDEHLLLGVRLQNSLSMSGVAFCGMDIGGFVGDCSPNLFQRWIQVGCFSPLMRIHGMIDSKPGEPWAYGERTEAVAKNFISLRYRLLPNLYRAFHLASKAGIPIQQSLALLWPEKDEVFDYRFHNQYIFAEWFLVAPNRSDAAFTEVYLPPNTSGWYSFWDGKHYHGNQIIIVASPPEYLPVFIKAGATILATQHGRNTSESGNELELHYFYGVENKSNTFYFDDGISTTGPIDEFSITLTNDGLSLKLSVPRESSHFNFKVIKLFTYGKQIKGGTHQTYKWLNPTPNFDPLGFIPPMPTAEVSYLRIVEEDFDSQIILI